MKFSGGKAAIIGLLVVGVALSACETKKETKGATLYDRLGGLGPINDVVEKFVANIAADNRINVRFANANMSRLKIRLVQLICETTGGPCRYQGAPMDVAHKGMDITKDEFNATGEALAKALDDSGVPAQEKGELLTAIGSMESDIVGK
jgi:hemoglobin